MKDVVKFTLTCLGIYAMILVMTFLFAGSLVSENMFFRWLSFGVVVLITVALGAFEGGTKGEADSAHQRLMEKRLADRGIEPTKDERGRFYKRWKGAVASFLSASPFILFALYVFFVSLSGKPTEWQTVTMRIMLAPYISCFPEDTTITWIYPVLTCIFPLSVTVGYLLGPRRFARLLRLMNENSKKRADKRRAKRKAVR